MAGPSFNDFFREKGAPSCSGGGDGGLDDDWDYLLLQSGARVLSNGAREVNWQKASSFNEARSPLG